MYQTKVAILTLALAAIVCGICGDARGDESSCLSRHPSSTAANVPPLETGIKQIVDAATAKYPNQPAKIMEVINQALSSPQPAPNPAYIDQFGIPVNPISLLPGYVTAPRDVLSLAVDPAKLMGKFSSDKMKLKAFDMVVSAYKMADDFLTEYRLRAAHDVIPAGERDRYVQMIGELWSRNDTRLKLFFGADTIRPGYVDGTVRAREALNQIDAQLRDENIKKAARDLYDLLQKTDSYYKNTGIEELECRIRELSREEARQNDETRAERVRDTTAIPGGPPGPIPPRGVPRPASSGGPGGASDGLLGPPSSGAPAGCADLFVVCYRPMGSK